MTEADCSVNGKVCGTSFQSWCLRGDGVRFAFKPFWVAAIVLPLVAKQPLAAVESVGNTVPRQPQRVTDGIILDLGVDSGLGSIFHASPRAVRNDRVMLVARISNFGRTRTVLGPSESSEFGRGNPQIELELRDQLRQSARRPDPEVVCGNLSELGDFVDLRDGESLKFTIAGS